MHFLTIMSHTNARYRYEENSPSGGGGDVTGGDDVTGGGYDVTGSGGDVAGGAVSV